MDIHKEQTQQKQRVVCSDHCNCVDTILATAPPMFNASVCENRHEQTILVYF